MSVETEEEMELSGIEKGSSTTTTAGGGSLKKLQGTYTFADAVEHIGFGRFHVMLLFLCGFGWFAEISELVIMSFVAPQIQKDFSLTPLEYGILGSISFIGMAVGSVFWGVVADRFGRWIGFTCTTWLTFIFSVASAFAPNYGVLLLFRILATIGVGGTLPVDYAHLVEFLPVKNRGRHMAIVDAMGVIPALLFSSLLAYFGSKPDGSSNWRLILGVQSVPAGLFSLLRFLIPESPRYHLKMDDLDGAKAVLTKVARMNKKELPEGDLVPLEGSLENRNPLYRFKELFSTKVLRATTPRIWFMAFCAQFASAGMVFTFPKLLEDQFDLSAKDVSLYLLLGIIGILPGLGIAWYVVELHRRRSLASYYLVSSIGSALFAVATLSGARNLIFALIASMILRGGMEGMFSILNTIRIEAYPTVNRVTAMGVSQLWYNIGGAISPLIFGAMYTNVQLTCLALSLYALAYLAGMPSTLTLPNLSDYTNRPVLDRIQVF